MRPGLEVEPATLLDRMLDPKVKLGTSTPKADPSGDYAFEVFRKAEAIKRGAQAALEKKALQLTGGPSSATAPAGRSVYGWNVAEGRADIFLTYCTGAVVALKENPGQQMVALPDALAVGADYGLTVMADASPGAYKFALFILAVDGQHILERHGFSAPGTCRNRAHTHATHCLEYFYGRDVLAARGRSGKRSGCDKFAWSLARERALFAQSG